MVWYDVVSYGTVWNIVGLGLGFVSSLTFVSLFDVCVCVCVLFRVPCLFRVCSCSFFHYLFMCLFPGIDINISRKNIPPLQLHRCFH